MTRTENGKYYWTGTLDKEYEDSLYRIVWNSVSMVCLSMLGIIGFLCARSGDWNLFLIGAFLPVLVIIGITSAIVWFYRYGPGEGNKFGFSMTESYIRMGGGKTCNYFNFCSARHVVFTKKYIDPKIRLGNFRIYVPEEDMPFVKEFVLYRLPSDCVIEDLSYLK